MKPELLPNAFLDKIADPAERKRILGTPLPSVDRHAKEEVRLERELHNLISNDLNRRGIVAIHSRTDKRTTNSLGIPDYCFAVNGYPIAVECKMGNNKLTPEQEATMLAMIKNGWAYYVVYTFQGYMDSMRPYFEKL